MKLKTLTFAIAITLLVALALTGCNGGSSSPPPPPNPNPTPTAASLNPGLTLAGGEGFNLTVTGTNFVSSSTVQWNGSPRATTFGSSTSLQAAINYYIAGYPAPPYHGPGADPPPVKAPTLVVYGRDDPHMLVDALDRTWDYIEPSVEIRVIAGIEHWVQLQAPATVNAAIGDWLARS